MSLPQVHTTNLSLTSCKNSRALRNEEKSKISNGHGDGDLMPLILFCILLSFGCYFLGKAKGRQEFRTNGQIYGIPTPTQRIPGVGALNSYPLQPHSKPHNSTHV
ncbi:hypothetical protein I3760_09G147400 [Carya illinoinensis]|nr:hypothetical protein I3760_09G147400 [Carya illinoinensis]